MKKIIELLNRFFCLSRLVNILYFSVIYLVIYQLYYSMGNNGWLVFINMNFILLMLIPLIIVLIAVRKAILFPHNNDGVPTLGQQMKSRIQSYFKRKTW